MTCRALDVMAKSQLVANYVRSAWFADDQRDVALGAALVTGVAE